ncbi:hypothetical protein [Polycladomyces subterraneus]|uniref:Uncharacterized protein n=1 Tax=Polycladomyces subterraneus TaxID=1016997 RepID=A0ABT8IM36_9BACL|nr:hypothetical protein [Polycladomyces subterraneus]MDN4593249.1 hypothetical protein [Polycladomyces subterraneus]
MAKEEKAPKKKTVQVKSKAEETALNEKEFDYPTYDYGLEYPYPTTSEYPVTGDDFYLTGDDFYPYDYETYEYGIEETAPGDPNAQVNLFPFFGFPFFGFPFFGFPFFRPFPFW